jgi:hypothetical protein
VVAVPSYFVLAGAIHAGKRLMNAVRWRTEQLAAGQIALRRVATAVVGQGPTERLYELVAREAGQLPGASASGILRLENDDWVVVLGSWPDMPESPYSAGRLIPVRAGGDFAPAVRLRKAVRVGDHMPDSPIGQLGLRCSITAPVQVGGRGGLGGADRRLHRAGRTERRRREPPAGVRRPAGGCDPLDRGSREARGAGLE